MNSKQLSLSADEGRLRSLLDRFDISLIDRFVLDYEPWPLRYGDTGLVIFTISALRTRFCAWLSYGAPDVWPLYQCELSERGFHLVADYDGSPVLPAHLRSAPISAEAVDITE